MDMGDVRGDVTLGGIKGMSDFRGLSYCCTSNYCGGVSSSTSRARGPGHGFHHSGESMLANRCPIMALSHFVPEARMATHFGSRLANP